MSIEEKQGQEDVVTFEKVLETELKIITKQRAPTDTPNKEMQLAGLAFSGGGIRSAVFNLGFIQGLANRNSLHVFDYLSTVSGGGYIGGWLSALLKRKATHLPAGEAEMRKVQNDYLKTPPAGVPPEDPEYPEKTPVRFLRRYANYLTPRLGLSGDTLALVALLARNVLVMQFLLVSMLVAVFSGLLTMKVVTICLKDGTYFQWHLLIGTLLSFIGALAYAIYLNISPNLRTGLLEPYKCMPDCIDAIADKTEQPAENSPMASKGQASKQKAWLIPLLLLVTSEIIALGIASGALIAWENKLNNIVGIPNLPLRLTIVLIMAIYMVIWFIGLYFDHPKCWFKAIAGIIGGAITLGVIANSLLFLPPVSHVTTFAPLVAMGVLLVVMAAHLAFADNSISEQTREWWARLTGQGILLAFAWTVICVFLLFVPPLLVYGWDYAIYWLISSGGLAATLTAFGTYFARSSDTGGKGASLAKEFLAKVAPWLFLALMLGLVSLAFVSTLGGVDFKRAPIGASAQSFQAKVACTGVGYPCDITQTEPDRPTLNMVTSHYQESLLDVAHRHGETIFAITSGAWAIFVILLWLVDLNIFSAHSFYANRLARTFLGASNGKRNANSYTGFDPSDDMLLSELACQRPIHLLNANMNMTGGDELAWQTRRGASFTFSPCYTGYSSHTSSGKPLGKFCPTKEYAGGLSLSQVIAACGAAASPNMGFHTSTSVAALLTAFNFRLARWCPNPEKKKWAASKINKWAAMPLFSELFGTANAGNSRVNISDGGHFENLGIYELIRRRVALIVVTDVGADPTFLFDDLAMAVRKIWVDFGVRVEIDEADLDKIRPKGKKDDKDECKDVPRFSEKYWALGRICYPDCAPGYLIYVKSAIAGDVPIDIRQYRDAHPAFPHEPTTDQWFDEDQFEAYRHLGQIIAEKLLDDLPIKINKGESGSSIIKKLYEKTQKHFQHTTW